MSKSLSELIEASWPIDYEVSPYGKTLCDRASYERMKRVAIELAKAVETLSVAVNDKVEDKGATNFCSRSLARAKDIIVGNE